MTIFTVIARKNVPAVQALVAARADLQVRGYASIPGTPRWSHAGSRWVIHAAGDGECCHHKRTLAAECGDERELPLDKADSER